MDLESCQGEWDGAVQDYNFACLTSLLFTFLALTVYIFGLKSRLDGAPGLGAQFFTLIALFQLIFAVAILFVFHPKCPEGCDCSGAPLPIFPGIALLISILWFRQARQFRILANAVSSDMDDKDGPIFDPVSTVEMA